MLGLGSPKHPRVNHTQSGSGHGGAVGQRALVAMAEAARRAREASSPTSGVVSEERTVVVGPPDVPPAAPQHHRAVEPAGDDRGRRRLKVSVLSLAVVVLLVATALAVTLATKEGPVSSPVKVRAATGGAGTGGAATGQTRTGGAATGRASGPAPTAPSSTISPPASSVPATGGGGPPVLSTLSPSTGTAGQSVVVSGTNFISADGVVQARFGGQLAPTACPVQTACTVTVPAMTGSPTSVPVTITTAGGTSNALTFTFG
jgi:IPT/TIG domain